MIYSLHMKLSRIRRMWFGDREFYKQMLVVAIPLIVTQMITSFVNMLDNIMVGRTGTLQMSGVSVANQLVMIFTLSLFGAVSAGAIFGAQYAGKKDWEGERFCLRYKLIVGILLSFTGLLISFGLGKQLIQLFLNPETNTAEDAALTLGYGLSYLKIIAVGLIPFAISTCLSSTMNELGETRLPMISSCTAVAVNFFFNLLLIFGYCGFPAMGCVGAAVATDISRIVQLIMNIVFVIRKKESFLCFQGIFHHFGLPVKLAWNITIKGLPLMLNEILWSAGVTAVAQCYSVRGIDAIAAYNIENTITNLFFVFNIAMGDCISIMVGQKLGAGEIEDAVDINRKIIVFTTILSVGLGAALAFTADLYPSFYNTTQEIQNSASALLKVAGWTLWISAIYNSAYFTLRCGGKTIITFLFDSAGTILVSFPIAYVLAHFTTMSLLGMFFVLRMTDFYKVILGLYLVEKRVWVNELVNE